MRSSPSSQRLRPRMPKRRRRYAPPKPTGPWTRPNVRLSNASVRDVRNSAKHCVGNSTAFERCRCAITTSIRRFVRWTATAMRRRPRRSDGVRRWPRPKLNPYPRRRSSCVSPQCQSPRYTRRPNNRRGGHDGSRHHLQRRVRRRWVRRHPQWPSTCTMTPPRALTSVWVQTPLLAKT